MAESVEESRKRLYSQSIAADRARIVLEELEGYKGNRERVILAKMALANSPQEAYTLACEWKAVSGFVNELKSRIAVGRSAAEELMMMEE